MHIVNTRYFVSKLNGLNCEKCALLTKSGLTIKNIKILTGLKPVKDVGYYLKTVQLHANVLRSIK